MKRTYTIFFSILFYLSGSISMTGQEDSLKFSISYWESYELPRMFLHGVVIGNQNYRFGFQYGQEFFPDQFAHIIGTDVFIRFYTSKRNRGKTFLYGRMGFRYAYGNFFEHKFNYLVIHNRLGYGVNLFDRISLSLDVGLGHTVYDYRFGNLYTERYEYLSTNPGVICISSPYIPDITPNASLNIMVRIF